MAVYSVYGVNSKSKPTYLAGLASMNFLMLRSTVLESSVTRWSVPVSSSLATSGTM